MSSAIIFQIQSALILTMMIVGISLHKKRNLHVKIMASSILWDILLILQIEFTRQAINKASKALSNPMILNIHVSLALSCVLLYFALIYTGRKVLRGEQNILKAHKILGRTTLILRMLVLITSFFVVS